jgi:hypothetical protein
MTPEVFADRRHLFASLLLLALPLQAAAAQGWFLMARHGECSPVSVLSRTFPDIGGIADPDAFVRFVRAKGLAVTSRPFPVPAGSAMEVQVPEKSLSLVFVTAELCSKPAGR